MASTSTSSNSGAGDPSKDKESRWYFTAEQLANSPSRRHGIDTDQELSFRQLTAYLIQEMGQRLQVSQLCINTAIVYMHRFYAFHSFTRFHRNGIAAASLFLAAKVEEQPRKLEHVIKVSHMCLNQEAPHPSTEAYAEQAQDLVFNENVLLQTLGFDVAIDHPHTHVVKTCHLVKACKDLAQTSYFLASNSLHLTSMCLQYRPTVVACFCIYLACKWSRWEIPQSTEGKHWFHYVDKGVTMDLLKQLTDEFIAIYEKSPARLKSKLNSIKALAQGARITEPPRNLSDSSNGSSSQMPQMEAARRPESYTSHHRSHHSSSHASVSHHHHSKQPPAGELSEHKAAVSHKQPYPPTAGTHSNRPRSDRSQVPNESQYSVPAHSSNKQLPIPSNSRPSSSSRPGHGVNLTGSSSSSQQRIPHSHDVNYHKSRGSLSTQVNPTLPSHKIPPKSNDSSRNVLQESSGRTVDPGKIHGKHNSSNMYPPLNPPNSAGTEATRNILPQQGSIPIQQQRPFIPPSSYNQLVSNRSSSNSSSSSSSSSNNNSNVKYEQSVQQQTHMHLNQKQSVESSFSTTNTRQLDDGMKLADQMEICSPTKYSSYPQQLQSFPLAPQQPQQTHSQSKPVSIFSPEWNEKPVIPATAVCNNNSNSNGSSKPLGLSIKSKDKDSPKKSERDKRSETPKKEKLRTEIQIQEPSKTLSSGDKKFLPPTGGVSKKNEATPLTNQNVPQIMPFDVKVKQEFPLNYSSSKRPANNEASVSRTQEDEGFRESKIRKVEPQSPPKFSEVKSSLPPLYEQQTTGEPRSVKSFPATINGIETNPDLVSSLLKESLCSDSKFTATALIKTESKDTESLTTVDQLTNLERVPQQILQTDIPIKQEALSPSDDHIKTKSEKKKKKDKHKHKEKDKVKDKEERKKHKKDKDRHKDKDKERIIVGSDSVEQNPVKIKISKDKLNLPLLEPLHPPTSGFKIKIPKDRIKGELSNFQPEESCNPLPLKIKISKDKIEVREMSQETTGTGVYSSSTVSHSHSSGNSSSSKKKDKDRDREKEKRRSGSDYNKQNGNSLAGSGGSAGSSSKSQSSSASKEII